ncbi:MAG: phosphoribosyltransferase [Rubrobacter sp.]|nr:phosphoribosyltransferase [Rubrobacter sp.]
MFYREPPFEDRGDAGRRLAEELARYRDEEPLVLALPRGGVPVGYEISRSLGAPLDVLVARKLGAPEQPELGIGAVAPGGVRVIDDHTVALLGLSEEEIDALAERELAEVERRTRRFREGRPEPELRDRTVILVDDGLATGVTARAAIEAVRQQSPRRLVLAVPVCAAQTAKALEQEVDALVSLETPVRLGAIGLWYRDFQQTPDEEVVRLLESARRDVEAPYPGERPPG